MQSPSRVFTRWALLGTGVAHFAVPRVYEPLVPDELPAHRALGYASGVAELAVALGARHPRTRRAAGWLGVATMAGLLPAHVHMLGRSERWPAIPRWAMWARLPLQAVFAWWIAQDTLQG